MTAAEKRAIINWICCDGQAIGIVEEGDFDGADVPEIENFINKCKQLLLYKIETTHF